MSQAHQNLKEVIDDEDVVESLYQAHELDAEPIRALAQHRVVHWRALLDDDRIRLLLIQAAEAVEIIFAYSEARKRLDPSEEYQGRVWMKSAAAFELSLASAAHRFPPSDYFTSLWQRLTGAADKQKPLSIEEARAIGEE